MKNFKSVIAVLLALVMALSCGVCAFAAAVEETDDNDAMETATAITLNDTASGRLGTEGDVDFFSVTFEAAGMATVNFNHDTVDTHLTYFTVKVLNKDGDMETEFTVYGDENATSSAMFNVDAGKYYIVIGKGQVESSTLAYSFSVKLDTEARAEKESNNTIETASVIELSTSGNSKRYVGNLSQNDVDNFVFAVPDDGFVYFYLYNTNGRTGDYKANVSTFVEGSGGVAEQVSLGTVEINKYEESVMSAPIGVKAGHYYFTISGTVGGYETRIFFSRSSEVYETEYNGNVINADYYSLGTKMAGSTFDKDDVDCYKFTVTEKNRKVNLVVSAGKEVVGSAKWSVKIIDAKENVIATEIATNNAPASIRLAEQAVGTYYLIIKADPSYANDGHYYISTTKAEEIEQEKTFFEKIKAIDWSGFLENFKGWLGKIDFVGIVKSIYQSIRTVIQAI